MKGKPWFEFRIKELPRTITKQRYKAVSHWLRYARWKVWQSIDVRELNKACVMDFWHYEMQQGIYGTPDEMYGKSPIVSILGDLKQEHKMRQRWIEAKLKV